MGDEQRLVTLLVPAYNEALKIMSSLTDMYAYMQGLADRYCFELLVIDDGSTDETAAIVEAFAATRPEVRLLRQPVNMRLGQALRDGFAASLGDIVVVFDSDLSYSVDHIGRMLQKMDEQHVAVVVASPYMKGGQTSAIPWNRAQMSKQINRVLAIASQYDVKTVTGMVRAYDGQFIRSLSLKSMGPEINTEILYKAQVMRARVAEIPAHLDWSDQAERMAKRKVSLKVTTTSKLLVFASFLYRPIIFFMLPGLILLAISLWSGGSLFWTVWHEAGHEGGGLDTRLTEGFAAAWRLRPQTFIIAGFTFVVSVQLISLGLLAAQAKRYFEELFYAVTHHAEH
ncbi:MAG: glycosyltransferase family 2 protein [Actinomycetota bacterium]|nr:glycosyltransferase family 2 protein [Actinomycetota bacterium]